MADFAGMVDIHCHFLPGVDDGAASLAEALDLVRAAHANGIGRILLTPHIHAGRYDNTLSALRLRFETFRRAIVSARIPVDIALAAEVRCSDELIGLIERGEIPFALSARGDRTLLLELPHSHVPPGVEQLVKWLRRNDITPLIVHPERNREFATQPQRLVGLCLEGCLTQVTAAAVIGRFGERAQRMAHWLLQRDLVTVVATDSHNLEHRPPLLREAAIAIAQTYGEECAWRLVHASPMEIAQGSFAPCAIAAQVEIDAMEPVATAVAVRKATAKRAPAPQAPSPEAIALRADRELCETAFARLRSHLRENLARAHDSTAGLRL